MESLINFGKEVFHWGIIIVFGIVAIYIMGHELQKKKG